MESVSSARRCVRISVSIEQTARYMPYATYRHIYGEGRSDVVVLGCVCRNWVGYPFFYILMSTEFCEAPRTKSPTLQAHIRCLRRLFGVNCVRGICVRVCHREGVFTHPQACTCVCVCARTVMETHCYKNFFAHSRSTYTTHTQTL